ncbi:ABC transporter ATP-binding protein [Rubeoparvulum massiliense]|uniref:ABC transporter ATP-binding protein n=1 Tax=Rubeoparvulum massiliense TaxID=1631346 RepID=UPI00065E2F3B|nr:ABC transporter ATP-binding protein [Rubeoparvulum massiliense]
MEQLLQVDHIETYIGQFHILQGVSFQAKRGQVTVLLGRNGAGKTTTLRSIMGFQPASRGMILFHGEEIQRLSPHQIAQKGIGYVPEDQGIFSHLTVEENMRVAMGKGDAASQERQAWILELFPDLKKAWKRKGGHLSGGQKQMLSLGRALLQPNDLLLIDEPSKGLAPIMVERVIEALNEIKTHTTIVLVEQNFQMASMLGDQYYLVDDGRTVHSGKMADLVEDEQLKRKYLGIA